MALLEFCIGILEQAFIFGVMVLGVYITYKILEFPDMSVEGSFPMGAAITSICLIGGMHPLAACLFAVMGGMICGALTGILHVKLKISNLLSGILVMLAMYSINLRIMGKSNVPFFDAKTVFSTGLPPVVIAALFAILVKVLLDLFLKTKFGFLLIAVGDNPELVTSLGIDTGIVKIAGLMISNSIVALSGSLMAQYQHFSDVGMGTAVMVMGLASVIIGTSIFKRVPFMLPTTMVLIGSVLYRTSIALALKAGLPATDFKLITSVIVIIALGLNGNKVGQKLKGLFARGGESHAPNSKSIESVS